MSVGTGDRYFMLLIMISGGQWDFFTHSKSGENVKNNSKQ